VGPLRTTSTSLVLPLTALVMGFWTPALVTGTGELAVKPDSASRLSPKVDPEQSPTDGAGVSARKPGTC
jgi:hypothetical protein